MKFITYCSILLLSITVSFTVFAQDPCDKMPVPDSTYLVSPANNTEDFSSREELLKWEPTGWAMKYELEVRRDSILSDTVAFDDKLELYADWLCGVCNRYQLHPLEGKNTYFWRVRAINSCGVGPWSEIRSFKTGYKGEQGIRLHFVNVPDSVRYAVISPRARWNNNYFNSVLKPIDNATVDFTEEDYPYLHINDVTILRIDFLAKESNKIYGHLEYTYKFAAGFDKSKRIDIYVYFHPTLKSDMQYFPGWDYYADKGEMPVSGLIPPSGLDRFINPNNTPVLLMRGAGSGNFMLTSDSLRSSGIDAWQLLYPFDGRIDTNAVILRKMVDTLSQRWYNGKRIGIAAHGTAGLIARYAVADTNYKGTFSKIATLGTPHFGSFLANKLLNSNTFEATVHPFLRAFDTQSPVIAQSQLGSDFLRRLNEKGLPPLYPGNEPKQSYLAIAGTKPIVFDIPHDEIPDASDGYVAAAAASLLNFDAPFVTLNISHNALANSRSYFDGCSELLAGFFSDTYSPDAPSQQFSAAAEGVWAGANNIIKPDNRILIKNQSLLWFAIDNLDAARCALRQESTTMTIIPDDKIPPSNTLYLQRQSGTANFTSRFSATNQHIGASIANDTYTMRLADYITVLPEPYETKLTPLTKAIPVLANVSPAALGGGRTNFYVVDADDSITSRWVKARNNRQNQPIFASLNKRVLSGFPRIDTVPVTIDPFMDTVLFILTAKDNITPAQFQKHGFRLKAPDGAIITPTTPQPEGYKPYSRFGFREFPNDRVAYYYIAQPKEGTWGLIYDTSNVRSWFTLSYLSEATLTVTVPDSIFKVNDKVPVTVNVLRRFFSEPNVTVKITDDGGALASNVQLKRISQGLYQGFFTANANGTYRAEARVIIDASNGRIDRLGYATFEVYDAIPDKPSLIAPLNTAFDVPRATKLIWKRDSKARSYLLQFTDDKKFSTFLINEDALTDTSYTIAGLDPKKTYYWRVRGRNVRGFGQWSEYFDFTTGLDILVTPRLLSPPDNMRTFSADTTLRWTTVNGAQRYNIQIATDSLFTKAALRLDTVLSRDSYRFTMQANQSFYWRIRAISDVGNSAWTDKRTFIRVLTAPTLLAPANQSINMPLTVQLRWSLPVKGLRYEIQLSRTLNFATILAEVKDLQDTSYTTVLPQNGAGYYWRVRWVMNNNVGDWSAPYFFTTILAAPRLDSPGDGMTGVNIKPTLTWRITPDVGYYHLQVGVNREMTNLVYQDSLLTVVSVPLDQLQPETQYYWRVRAKSAIGTSTWSQVWTFRTGANPNTSVSDIIPGVRSTIYPNPNHGHFTLSFNQTLTQDIHLTIANLYGDIVERVYCLAGANNIDINVQHLPAGIYYINGNPFVVQP